MQGFVNVQNQRGGLCHLVEAATALTSLVHTYPPNSVATKDCSSPPPSVVSVSDDESMEQLAKKAATEAKPSSISNNNNRKEIFPQRLLAVLADSSLSDVISWLPHGRSFVIIRPDVFASQVLPKYLPSEKSSTKYPSFTRKLNRWGFRQATRGPDTGAFYHPLFCRDEPNLCLDMVCQKSRKSKRPSTKNNKDQNKRKNVSKPSSKTGGSSPSQSSSSLPPKKRKLSANSTGQEPQTSALNEPVVVTPPRGQQSVSPLTAASPAVVLPSHALVSDSSSLSSWVPSDPKLVASTLKARDDMEKLSVAKSILYDSYLKALQG